MATLPNGEVNYVVYFIWLPCNDYILSNIKPKTCSPFGIACAVLNLFHFKFTQYSTWCIFDVHSTWRTLYLTLRAPSRDTTLHSVACKGCNSAWRLTLYLTLRAPSRILLDLCTRILLDVHSTWRYIHTFYIFTCVHAFYLMLRMTLCACIVCGVLCMHSVWRDRYVQAMYVALPMFTHFTLLLLYVHTFYLTSCALCTHVLLDVKSILYFSKWSDQKPTNCPHEDTYTHVCSSLVTSNFTCITIACCGYFEKEQIDYHDGDYESREGEDDVNIFYIGRIDKCRYSWDVLTMQGWFKILYKLKIGCT